MTKQEIVRDLTKVSGCAYCNVSQIAKTRQKSRDWARKLVQGLPYFYEGNSKEYRNSDVAERMMERVREA